MELAPPERSIPSRVSVTGCGIASASESKALADYLVAEVTQQVTQCLQQAFAAAIKSQMESSYAALRSEMLAVHNVMTSAIKSEMLVVHNVMASAIKSEIIAAHEVMTKIIINSLPSDTCPSRASASDRSSCHAIKSSEISALRSEIVADVSSAMRSAHEVMTRTIIRSLSSDTGGSSSRRSSLLSDHDSDHGSVFCSGTNRDGSACKKRGIYCDNHNHKDRTHPPQHARCSGITKKGEQCRRETSDGSGHCKSHRPVTDHCPSSARGATLGSGASEGRDTQQHLIQAKAPERSIGYRAKAKTSAGASTSATSTPAERSIGYRDSEREQQHADNISMPTPTTVLIRRWAEQAKTSARASTSAASGDSAEEQQHDPSRASRPETVASAEAGTLLRAAEHGLRASNNCGITMPTPTTVLIRQWTEQATAKEKEDTSAGASARVRARTSAEQSIGYRDSAGEQQDNSRIPAEQAKEANTRSRSKKKALAPQAELPSGASVSGQWRQVATPAAPAELPSRSLPVSRNDLVNSKFVISTGIDFEEDGVKEQPPRKIAVKSYISPTDTRFIDFSNYDNLDATHLDSTYNLYVDNRLVLEHVKLRNYMPEIQLIGRIFKQS